MSQTDKTQANKKTSNKTKADKTPRVRLSADQKAIVLKQRAKLRAMLPLVKAIERPCIVNDKIMFDGKEYPSKTQAFIAYNARKREVSQGIDCKAVESVLFKHSAWNMHDRSGNVTTLSECKSVDVSVLSFVVFRGTDESGKRITQKQFTNAVADTWTDAKTVKALWDVIG